MNLQTAERVRKILVITSTIAKETSAETCWLARAGCMALWAPCKGKNRTNRLLGPGRSPGPEPGGSWDGGRGDEVLVYFVFFY